MTIDKTIGCTKNIPGKVFKKKHYDTKITLTFHEEKG